ncbi:MAG: hypothetical protein ACM3ME_02750 [Chloroflexota bacterium]|nr:hypothetical protein [Lentimicrobium sp.]
MVKKTLIQTLLILSITVCYGQISVTSTPGTLTHKTCKLTPENKEIRLCNVLVDTITYAQLAECHKLTILTKSMQAVASDKRITSFILTYFPHDSSDVIQSTVIGNEMPGNLVSSIIESGTKKILIEEIIGLDGTINLDLGHRWFYIR